MKVYPYAEISVKPRAVGVNEPMLVTVTGYDNYDIELIALYYNGVWHEYKCEGIQKECSNTWEVKQKTPGSYLYHAYVRDNSGNYPTGLVSARATVYEDKADYFEAAVGKKKSIDVNQSFTEEGFYYYDLDIGKAIYSMTIKATVRFRQENGYARLVLRDNSGKEYLIYEIYPLVSRFNYVEVSSVCEETCALNGVIPTTIKIQVAYADLYLKEISYSESPGLISQGTYSAYFVPYNEKLKYGQQIAKMQTVSENMKNRGAYWVAGITQLAVAPYQEKKKIFSGEVPVLHGAEYTVYGAFQLPEPKKACECVDDTECSEGQKCDGCNCISNERKCEVIDYYCKGNVLYWKNSCGEEGVQDDCSRSGWVCEGKNCVPPTETPCQKRSCAYYAGRGVCGVLDDGCNGTISCGNICSANEECSTTLSAGVCVPKQQKTPPSANCADCYEDASQCVSANSSGFTSKCNCAAAVICGYNSECNCMKFQGCNNGLCESTDTNRPSTQPSPSPICPACYKSIAECKTAYGGGLTRTCDCTEAVICKIDTQCNCYVYGSCVNSVCAGGGCQLKTCDDYKGKCGTFADGCGGQINCGCPAGQTCNTEKGLCEGSSGGDQNKPDQNKPSTPKPQPTCQCSSDTTCKILFNMETMCCDGCNCYMCSTCTDSDRGENYKVKGTTSAMGFTYADYCTADGKLVEYYCFDLDTILSKVVNCESGYKCVNGACVPDGGGSGGTDSGQQPTCSDSDGGRDIFTFGKVTYNNQTLSDYCEPGSTSQLTEYYCENNQPKSSVFTCPIGYSCVSGKCAQPSQAAGCTDSDGGKEIFIKGVVEFNGNYYPDICTSSGGIMEHYCETSASGCDTNSVKYYTTTCPTGYRCIDGACQKDTGQPTTCTDSDGGRDYYVRGTTTDPKGSYVDKCSADGTKLYEYYCVWNNAEMEEYPTPHNYVCKDGAFVEAKPSSNCSDSDGGRNVYEKGTVNENGKLSTDHCSCGGSKVVEYFCSGGMTAVSEEYCPTGYTCKDGACVQGSSPEVCNDTDGGKNFNSKGSVTFGGQTYTDFCNGSVVNEYYCENNQGRSTTYSCPYGCSDGACVSSSSGKSGGSSGGLGDSSGNSPGGSSSGTQNKCTDSDGGMNGAKKGTVTYEGKSYTDSCQDSKNVFEYFCQNDQPYYTVITCPSVCENGACKISSSGSGSGTGSGGTTDDGSCWDSDGGPNAYVKGTTTWQGIPNTDYCKDGTYLNEYFCSSTGTLSSTTITCTGGCSDGACR
ncbi:MAG: hypothetical protein QW400_02980 [Candidatus Diapherotrites archaeon]